MLSVCFFSCNVSSPSPLSALSETSTVMKESEAEGSSDARHHSRPTSRADVTTPLFLLLLPLLSFLPGLVFESDHIKSLVLDV